MSSSEVNVQVSSIVNDHESVRADKQKTLFNTTGDRGRQRQQSTIQVFLCRKIAIPRWIVQNWYIHMVKSDRAVIPFAVAFAR